MIMDCKYVNFKEPNTSPYSDMVVIDDRFLFLSGLISEDLETGQLVHGSITEETKRVFDNLETILDRYGSNMDHVIRVEVLLADFAERDEMNIEYVKHFSADCKPSRLCYGGVDLAAGCKIEILVTAVKA